MENRENERAPDMQACAVGHGHGHGHAPRTTAHEPRRTESEANASSGNQRRRNDLHRLDVYRCALQVYRSIGRIVNQVPRGEADLRSQMKRAGRSVPLNIGEGVGKRGRARAAAYEVALGEAKELIVALDCVEIDELASIQEIVATQDLADRVSAMLTNHSQHRDRESVIDASAASARP